MGLPQLCIPRQTVVAPRRNRIGTRMEPARRLGRRLGRDGERGFMPSPLFTICSLYHVADVHVPDDPVTTHGACATTAVLNTPSPLRLKTGVVPPVRAIPGRPCDWSVCISSRQGIV